MGIHFTKHNFNVLLSITNLLEETINLIGKKAVSTPFSEKKLLKHALLDLCKQIYGNIAALNTLLSGFDDERNNFKRVPIALIIRGVITDCLTGTYLITFRNCDESLKNEIHIMSVDYAKFLRLFEEEQVKFLSKYENIDVDKQLREWEINFKRNYPILFKSQEDSEWLLKSPKDLRATSKIILDKSNGRLTEAIKAERINNNDKNGDYRPLFIGYKYFSQYQHYSFSNRKMIVELREEFFGILYISLGSIVRAISLFSSILVEDENEKIIKKKFTTIYNLYVTIK